MKRQLESNKSTAKKPKTSKQTKLDDNSDLDNFNISEENKLILKQKGINSLFPIQVNTFNPILKGSNLLGRAKTGTGKTLAFTLPLVERLFCQTPRVPENHVYILVLAPTRELAIQISAEFLRFQNKTYKSSCFYGGVAEYPQIQAIREGLQVVIGTTGRILDFLRRGILKLGQLEALVLDEADTMLEMGFREDVEEILNSHLGTAKPQFLFFSATVPRWVTDLADKIMGAGKVVVDVVEAGKSTIELNVEAEGVRVPPKVDYLTIQCGHFERGALLADIQLLYGGAKKAKTIIFTETKAQANEIAVSSSIAHDCQVIHGDVSQAQREATLRSFRKDKFSCLVATDVAARGIDIDNVRLVIQMDLPKDVDTFTHRSGRTGRANRGGTSLVFCRPRDAAFLNAIENKLGIEFKRVAAPQPSAIFAAAASEAVAHISNETVPKEAHTFLMDQASKLILDFGAEEALVRCLVKLAGLDFSVLGRSALTGRADFRTFCLRFSNTKLDRPGYAWRILKKLASDHEAIDRITGMTLFKDQTGVVFDVPADILDVFESLTAKQKTLNDGYELSSTVDLPETMAHYQSEGDFGGEKNMNHRNRLRGGGSSYHGGSGGSRGSSFSSRGISRGNSSRGISRGTSRGISRGTSRGFFRT